MVASRLKAVRSRIEAAAERVDRDPGAVTLVAISKGHSDDSVLEAYDAGQRDFGENRSDGFVSRLEADLPDDIRWHFVGSLQRRKVADVVAATHLLHSMDRESLGARWVALGGGPALLQVNVSRALQKHGVDPRDALDMAGTLIDSGVDLRGVMAIPAVVPDREEGRSAFNELAALRDQIRRTHAPVADLSMGMTDDLEVGVECGATIVRVGRAIFGERPGG